MLLLWQWFARGYAMLAPAAIKALLSLYQGFENMNALPRLYEDSNNELCGSGLLGYAMVPPAAQSSAQPSAQPHELKNLNGATYWHATATLATATSTSSAPSRATAATAPTTLPATLPLAAAAATSASHAQATTRALPGVQVPTVPPLMYPSNVARASSFSTRTPFDAIEGGADAALDDQVGDA